MPGQIDYRFPETLTIQAEIKPVAEFSRPIISTTYRVSEDDDEERTMAYDIYGGDALKMRGFVSGVDITFKRIPSDLGPRALPKDKRLLEEYLQRNPVLYQKKFNVQRQDATIPNFDDDSLEESDIFHTKTKAHFFAGSYHRGIKLSDIQQYTFYMGTGYRAEEYIAVLNARDLVDSTQASPAPGVTLSTLSTLEDDIVEGKIEFSIPHPAAEFSAFARPLRYKSVAANKDSLTSNIFDIILQREISEDERRAELDDED
jgi:hypothetical protein